MGLEEDLLEAMRYASLDGKMPANKMIQAIINNAQVGALKHLRDELDKMIRQLADKSVDTKGMGELDPFKILRVRPNATKEEVKSAYRKRSAEAHPDHGGSNEEMMKVNAAYEAIQRVKGWI